ncbi:low molecular weight protein-tyrosine-phosphatase [Phormidium tenue]|uniref:protein-tyrosine-phosphatase n=1 Tax=Phormidium tenue NIES-30 TaxID=549789 RepID=A0A1U7IYR3_9CYAN|nr:low molecular weight protein-tyrosine-phosphatase [Phormidium tenue]MBD2234849.1 low molecular weight phosphotyrosine protein phosphatase [Phormidium tenue FACHB-1052]OKH43792.1 protein tyrosine phosphatase [Phormidium tenue NIES-30]
MTTRLLFVCLGNICRSPSAENIMNHLIEQRQLSDQVVCDSAGTASYHVGSAPDRRMAQAAQAYGIDLVGRARQFDPVDFDRFDYILAMDRQNYRDILALDPAGQYRDRVRLMCDFCRTHPDKDVPDPYYGGPEGFTYVIDLLLDACEGLLDHISAQPVAIPH